MKRMDIKHVNVKFLYSVKCTYDIPSAISSSFFFFFAIYSSVLGSTQFLTLGSTHHLFSGNGVGGGLGVSCESGVANQVPLFPALSD